jgi:lysophospholipase L1-like esterase
MGDPNRRSSSRASAALLVLVSSLLTLAAAEAGLRLWPARPPRPATFADYGDAVRTGDLGPGGFLKEGFEGRLADGRGGTIRWKNNAQGFRRDADTAAEPAPGVVRILSMGDSFTAGYRVDQEATFSRLLERNLAEAGVPAEVLIAETEEPVTGLWWLRESGLAYRPRLVILGITLGNDLAQAALALDAPGEFRLALRGGGVEMERLRTFTRATDRPEFELKLPPDALRPDAPARLSARHRPLRLLELACGPPPQPIGTSRGADQPHMLFDGVNSLGFFLSPPPREVEAGFERLERTLAAYAATARGAGARLLVLFFPQRYQVQPEDWEATVEGYGLNPARFDLRAPGRRLAAFCLGNAIPFLDLAPALAAEHARSGRSLYLPGGDMHWNAGGHRAVAAAVEPAVLGLIAR